MLKHPKSWIIKLVRMLRNSENYPVPVPIINYSVKTVLGLHAVQRDGGIWKDRVPLVPDLWSYGECLDAQNMHFGTASVT